jgi:hypothetical protein
MQVLLECCYIYLFFFSTWKIHNGKMKIIYIDDVLSLNNSRFGDFVDRIYPIEVELEDTTVTASYIGLLHTLTYTSK